MNYEESLRKQTLNTKQYERWFELAEKSANNKAGLEEEIEFFLLDNVAEGFTPSARLVLEELVNDLKHKTGDESQKIQEIFEQVWTKFHAPISS